MEGQARLSEATCCPPVAADADAADTAKTYLRRAGLDVRLGAPTEVPVPAPLVVEAIAGQPVLVKAASAVAGAFAAVETIKLVLEVGRPATRALPSISDQER